MDERARTGHGPSGRGRLNSCDTFRMTETRHTLRVIEGSPVEELDLVHLFEELDARDALPILRQRMRQQKAAANSVLASVEPSRLADPQAAPDVRSTTGPA